MSCKDRRELDALLERLFEAYHLPILNYLYRLVGDASRAEELAQDVYVRAYAALSRLPEDANQRAWLYRIATNIAIDHLRRQRLLKWLPLQDTDGQRSAQHTREQNIDEALGMQAAVQAALERVTPSHRAALILFGVQGYSVREIAQILNLSEGAVKTRLSRARESFRRAYEKET